MIHIRRVTAANFKQLVDVDLVLPGRGRFLVQGLNEAGKSTLFEAIFFGLFGQPLATETASGRLDDVIRYGAEAAYVAVDLSLADGKLLSVKRRVRRGKTNVWELDLRAPDGSVEEIRSNRAVNARIEAELGFDGEALLNTCFVEQKKLEKLEGMTLAQRHESLMKLLNLDRLVEIGDRLRVRPADRQHVDRLRARRDLARLQAERPVAAARHAEVRALLDRAEVAGGIQRSLADLAALEDLSSELAAARAREAELSARAAEAERLAAARASWQHGLTARERALDAAAAADRAAAALAGARSARDVDIPAIIARGRALGRLKRWIDFLATIEAENAALAARIAARDADLERLAGDRAALNQVRQALVEARGAAREEHDAAVGLEQDVRAFDVREALAEWIAVLGTPAAGRDVAAGLDAARAAHLSAVRRARNEVAGLAVAAALGVVAFVALVSGTVIDPSSAAYAFLRAAALGLTALAVALALWRAWAYSRASQARALAIGRLEGEASVAAREAESLARRHAAAAARFQAVNAVQPADLARARAARDEIDARLVDRTRAEVEAALNAVRDRLARAKVESETHAAREAELRAAVGRLDGAALGRERDGWAARAAKIDDILRARRPRVDAAAAALGVADAGVAVDISAVDGDLGGLRAELRELRERAARAADLEVEHSTHAAAAERHWDAAQAAWSQVGAIDETGAIDAIDSTGATVALDAVGLQSAASRLDHPSPWSRDLTERDWRATGDALTAAYAAAGGDAVRQALEQAARAAAELAGRASSARRALASSAAQWRARWADLAVDPAGRGTAGGRRDVDVATAAGGSHREIAAALAAVDAQRDLSDLSATREAWRRAHAHVALDPATDVAGLSAEHDALRARLDVVRHEIGRLERELGLPGEVLDEAHEAAVWQAAARALAVRERGAAIVEHASRNLVTRVLPSTLLHMRRVLPVLTQGRYFDAGLSDDYRIEVYDDRAGEGGGAWKKKNIFSGGTRDQLSLALRLAFALATLPEERGAAPGFLFLDEPLGAFDADRARALIDLITEGEVAESFDQIFLISHVAVDGALFDYHVHMADGRVVESDLPQAGGNARPIE